MCLANELGNYIRNQYKNFDLSYEEAYLIMQVKTHAPMTQKELANILNITPATLSTRLKRLEKLDYITRKTDLEDTRKTNVELTETGIGLVQCAMEKFQEITQGWESYLNENEKQQYFELTQKILTNMKGEKND